MIVIAAYLQNGGIAVIIAVIVVTGWAWGARVLRSQTQSLRGRDFVTAAQFSGEGATRIVFREILPNMTSLIVGSFFGAATSAILAEAGLEFLGLGDSSIVAGARSSTGRRTPTRCSPASGSCSSRPASASRCSR